MSKSYNLIDEYFDYQSKYEKQYGKNTLVLMQVGSFFEAYQTLDKGYDLSKISSILNVILSRKNKSISTIDKKNPYMLGFPVPVITKYMKILMENGFTIILIEQTTPPPNPKREITNIYSPATFIDIDSESGNYDNKYILSIFIEQNIEHRSKQKLISVGLALLDLSTGKSMVHEIHSSIHDDKVALDEAVKFINSYSIKEIIITTNKLNIITNHELVTYLEVVDKTHHIKTLEETEKEVGNKLITNITFQEEFLKKIYGTVSLGNTFIEELDLESEYGRNAFIILLKYAIDHNRNIVNKLDKPEMYGENKYLHIGNNASLQLNIFNTSGVINGTIKSVFDVINKTSTPMGRRLLKNSLVQPLTDTNILNKRYEFIANLMENDLYIQYDDILKEVGDIERLERKMKISNLHPMEMSSWIKYQYSIAKLFKLMDTFFDYNLKDIGKKHDIMMNNIEKTLITEDINKYLINDITNNIFHEGVHPEIDDIQNEIDVCNHFMDCLADKLNKFIQSNQSNQRIKGNEDINIKVESNDRDGHFLILTKRRADILEKELAKLNEIDFKVGKTMQKVKPSKLTFKHATGKAGYTKIFLPELDKNSDRIIALTMKLKNKVKTLYENYLVKLINDYGSIMSKITEIVSLLDFLKSGAKVAHMFRYTRPEIIDTDKSFIKVKQLRHPIVERINNDTEYVPLDLELGVDKQDGILLYGLNSAGKSTLQKAVGISIIMAQIGYYVPASSYKYSPYFSLFTRISGNDNLFKGLSSFTLELMELQAILKRSGENTLVIADEIASGTEHQSALIIVMTMIDILSQSKSSFITATHLHELVDMEVWKDIKNVQVYHLHVEFDEINNVLVYDRTLRTGHGSSFYGLQVAKYLINDKLFLEKSTYISKNIGVYTFVSDKTSRYNSKVLMDKCQVCEHKPKKDQIPLETHHIEFQKNTDKEGFLLSKPHKHKNHQSNLVVLCSKCHDKIDTGELCISGYKKTTKGRKLESISI